MDPMNATSHHQKVKLSLTLDTPQPILSSSTLNGSLQMECRADNGLGLSVLQTTVIGIQELTSRDHSATNMFLNEKVVFQDRSRPSNAVYDLPEPGHMPLPPQYFTARKGRSTFPFSIPLPRSLPASISFAKGLARVKYELKASVEVIWRDVRSVVVCSKPLEVVESFNGEVDQQGKEEGETLVAENGKMWVRGKVLGGVLIAGESAAVEFWVRNHTNKKNSSLGLTLTRSLSLPANGTSSPSPPLNLTDTLTEISFRGGEYTIPPGAEGVATLVFEVPLSARSVRGGLLGTGDKLVRGLFEIRASVSVRMGMGIGSKDVVLEIPVPIVHPLALPPPPMSPPMSPIPYANSHPAYLDLAASSYVYPNPTSGYYEYPGYQAVPYVDHTNGMVFIPTSPTPTPYPVIQGHYYYPPPPIPHPSMVSYDVTGLPPASTSPHLFPPQAEPNREDDTGGLGTTEEGSGPTASRIAYHLRMTSKSRGRSVSPVGRRQLPSPPPQGPPPPASPPVPVQTSATSGVRPTHIQIPKPNNVSILSPRPLLSPRSMTSLNSVKDIERMAADEGATEPEAGKGKEREEVQVLANIGKETTTKRKSKQLPSLEDTPTSSIPPPMSNIDKTLPRPPPPTLPPSSLPPSSSPAVPPVEEEKSITELLASEPAPKTPTLVPLSTTPKVNKLLSPSFGLAPSQGGESGLDALEKRLLAEVGTRKPPPPRALDVREAFRDEERRGVDIPIPLKRDVTGGTGGEESAISSLTLAGVSPPVSPFGQHMRLGAAHAMKTGGNLDVIDGGGEGGGGESDSSIAKTKKGRSKSSADDAHSSSRKSKHKERKSKEEMKEEARGSRENKKKRAKGKVAAWLGGIESPSPRDATPDLEPEPPSKLEGLPAEEKPPEAQQAPDSRSSGFVPVHVHTTIKAKSKFLQQQQALQAQITGRPVVGNPSDEAKKIADLWAAVPPEPSSSMDDEVTRNPWLTSKPLPKKTFSERKPTGLAGEEVKYDIRSARGGRGGVVTTVRAIWAANESAPTGKKTPKALMNLSSVPPPVKPKPKALSSSSSSSSPPKPSFSTAKPKPKPLSASSSSSSTIPETKPNLIKASHVPAVVSSSHAVPMLSSTASLARPARLGGGEFSSNANASSSTAAAAGKEKDKEKFGAGRFGLSRVAEEESPAPTPPPSIAKPKGLPPRVKHGFSDLSNGTSPTSSKSPASPFRSEAIKGLRQVNGLNAEKDKPAPAPEMAFGQAKLRDLIRKYQGGGL